MPRQEPGVRRSCPLPYELYVDGALNSDRTQFTIRMESRKDRFGERSAGCPFTIYAHVGNGDMQVRDYAVAAGDHLEDSWPLGDFADSNYRLQVHGPNGFFREFIGSPNDPLVEIRVSNAAANGAGQTVELQIVNLDDKRALNVEITDRAYKLGAQQRKLIGGGRKRSPSIRRAALAGTTSR